MVKSEILDTPADLENKLANVAPPLGVGVNVRTLNGSHVFRSNLSVTSEGSTRKYHGVVDGQTASVVFTAETPAILEILS